MRLDRIIRGIAPIIAVAAAAGLARCHSGKVSVNGEEGVPLAELDLSGAPPSHVMLLGPDAVIISEGASFMIEVDGTAEARERVRFVLKDDTLGVIREKGNWSGRDSAIIRVTMPAPSQLTIAGAGVMTVDALADSAEIVIAGSGTVNAAAISVAALDMSVAGSGSAKIGGTASALSLTIAGSGYADMGELTVDQADISIAGSGHAVFASDGTVEAEIMGSGHVTVRGSATCTVQSMGSGQLRCERAAQDTGKAA